MSSLTTSRVLDPAEVLDYLERSGVSGGIVETILEDGVAIGTRVTAPAGLTQALIDAFVATPAWRPPLPASLATHAGHLRDYEQAVRAGTAVTNAQTIHVIADIIAYIRLTEERL